MTPAIFVVAALAMAVRYISLGLDDQDLYILAGIAFALMYGLQARSSPRCSAPMIENTG